MTEAMLPADTPKRDDAGNAPVSPISDSHNGDVETGDEPSVTEVERVYK